MTTSDGLKVAPFRRDLASAIAAAQRANKKQEVSAWRDERRPFQRNQQVCLDAGEEG